MIEQLTKLPSLEPSLPSSVDSANGGNHSIPQEQLDELRTYAELFGSKYCVIYNGVETCVMPSNDNFADVNKLERVLRGNPPSVDKDIIKGILESEVSLPNGIAGKIGEILNDEEKTESAIEAAAVVYESFYRKQSVHKEDQVVGVDFKLAEVNAYLGILKRANHGKYNGKSAIVGEFAKFKVGSYLNIGDTLHAGNAVELSSDVIEETGGVIFSVEDK
jgi:hypothetical protein